MKKKDIKICGLSILGSVALLNTVSVSALDESVVSDTNQSSQIIQKSETFVEIEANVEIMPIEEDTTIIEGINTSEVVMDEGGVELDAQKAQLVAEDSELNRMSEKEETVTESSEQVESDITSDEQSDIMLDTLIEENHKTNDIEQPVIEKNDITNRHQWHGTFFGESTNESKNSVTINNDGSVTLKAANFDPETKIIQDKGGKFTSYHDGITYYYTEIDAKHENFTFSATFNVDYLNPKADGQEGFGIIVRDQIGYSNTGDQQFPSNSVAAIATKVKVADENAKPTTLKPGLATRFVTGLTEEIIEEGATSISAKGKSETIPFKDDMTMKVEEGKKYTFTVKKTNTGYHAVYEVDGEILENILYGTDKLLQIDRDKIYVGIAAARGVVTTVSDMILEITNPNTDAPAEEEPLELIEPSFKFNNYNKTGNQRYNLELVTNVPGKATIYDSEQNVIGEITLEADYPKFVEVDLLEGDNQYTAKFEASNPELLTDSEPLISETLIHHKTFDGHYKGNIGTYLTVSPSGTAEGDGTLENPLDIFTAIDYIKPGQMIELMGGVYEMNRNVIIHRGNNGTNTLNKLMGTVSIEPAIFDFTKGGAFLVNGDYWKIDNIHVRNTQGNVKGMTIGGNYNHLQRIEAYNNGDTGIQISGNAAEHYDLWPKYNVIENSTSYNNVDPGHNNADGFAAKITVGEGNLFRGNIAYNNVDDGWDLFAKLESGLIGTVTIEDSIAFRNGTNLEKNASGDGNGFKLGGDGIAIEHILRNSLSFDNDADGVTSNSNPAANVYNVITVKNKGTNLSLYGKGNTEVVSKVEGIITWDSQEEDRPGNESVLNNSENYINGKNIQGDKVDESWFEKTDLSLLPTRNEDGSINLNGLFVLTNGKSVVSPISSQPLVPYFVLDNTPEENTNEDEDKENPNDNVIEDDNSETEDIGDTEKENNTEEDTENEDKEAEETEAEETEAEETEQAKGNDKVVNSDNSKESQDNKQPIVKLTKASQLPATGEKKINPILALPLMISGFVLSYLKRKK